MRPTEAQLLPQAEAEHDGIAEGVPSTSVALSLLGGFSLRAGQSEIRIVSRKARALLAYLAMFGGTSERREKLCGLLWSEFGEQNARTSLRQALFEIRNAVQPFHAGLLIASRDEIGLLPGSVALDTDALVAEIEAGQLPERLLAQPVVGEAVLPGFEDLSPIFGEWLAEVRQRLHNAVSTALQRAYSDTALAHVRRRRFAEAAFRLDSLDEAACRAVMQLAAEAGETGAALRAYGSLYQSLDVELDMEPAAATQELVARIKQGHLEAEAAQQGHPAVPRLGAGPASAAASGAGEPVVAILPFRSVGPQAVPDFFTDGVVQDIVGLLSGLREPVVISSNSTLAFRETGGDLAVIGRRLGAEYLVSGTLRAAAEHARLSVELAEAATGAVLWAKAYDIADEPLFEMQDRIALNIATTLVPRVQEAELRRSRRTPPSDLGAYHLMLQARSLVFELERNAFDEAGRLLDRALALDPGYSATRAAKAAWHGLRLGQGWSDNHGADERALEHMARMAISLDGGNAPALALLGHNRAILHRDYEEAVHLFDRALEASPNDAEGWMWSSPTFAYMGEVREGLHRAERALRLSPRDPFLFRYEHFLSVAHYAAGEYEAAVHWGQRSHGRNPLYTANLRMTAASLAATGRSEEAQLFAGRVLQLQPGYRVTPMIARQAFRDPSRRETYGQHLMSSGLPA